MTYSVNPQSLFGAFSVPGDVVDKHIKLAGAVQLKVLLYIFRNPAAPIEAEGISAYLSVPASDVRDCLQFWADAGILICDGKTVSISTGETKKAPTRTVRPKAIKPSHSEVAKRGLENEEISFLLRETQQKLGRTLRDSESSTLVWLYDDEGVSVSVLLMAVEFAISDGKGNIGYIEKTVLDWIDSGVETAADAEKKIAEIYKNRTYFAILRTAFGLGDRLPGKKEQEYANLWIGEWKLSRDMLRAAYETCVDNTGKYSLPYIAKVLKMWHEKGYKSPEDIKDEKSQTTPRSFDTSDHSLFQSMLSAIDED